MCIYVYTYMTVSVYVYTCLLIFGVVGRNSEFSLQIVRIAAIMLSRGHRTNAAGQIARGA